MTTASGVKEELNQHEKKIWEMVSLSSAKNLWDLREVSIRDIAKRTVEATLHDRLLCIASELGFWFVFALFPALFCATTIMGLAARSAAQVYDRLLTYLALVVPNSALGMVLRIFNQTTTHSSSGKLTFGLVMAIWSASVGISAVQDATNAVYKIVDRRSYLKARFQAILLTLLLLFTLTLCLTSMFTGDFVSAWLHHSIHQRFVTDMTVMFTRVLGWALAVGFLAISFGAVYYWAPDLRKRQWHWITPGAMLGVAGWFLASIGFRIYIHFFNTYSITYGSLGAIIILLMWFYITGLMLLLGAEFNSELEAAAMEVKLRQENAGGRQSLDEHPPFTPAA